jgi:ribosomal protein S18 acetylase RimI-like enzyme
LIALRDARPDDFAFFYATRQACFAAYVTGAWDEAVHAAEFAEMTLQIVEDDGTPIGYLAVKREPDHWFVEEIALVAQNTGLGTRLLRAVMDGARAAGLPLRLSVREGNPARRLYERLGFRVARVEAPRIKMEWP